MGVLKCSVEEDAPIPRRVTARAIKDTMRMMVKGGKEDQVREEGMVDLGHRDRGGVGGGAASTVVS